MTSMILSSAAVAERNVLYSCELLDGIEEV